MPCAIVLGPPPAVAYCAPQKLRMGLDEVAVAGGIAGAPIGVVRCRTVDLTVPADSEIVVEGRSIPNFSSPRRRSARATAMSRSRTST